MSEVITLKIIEQGPPIALKLVRAPASIQQLQVRSTVPHVQLQLRTIQTPIVLKQTPQLRIVLKYSRGQQLSVGPPANFIVGEVPLGVINGSNATFTSLNDFDPLTVEVQRNGMVLTRVDDFNTLGHRTITLAVSPVVGDHVTINYEENI